MAHGSGGAGRISADQPKPAITRLPWEAGRSQRPLAAQIIPIRDHPPDPRPPRSRSAGCTNPVMRADGTRIRRIRRISADRAERRSGPRRFDSEKQALLKRGPSSVPIREHPPDPPNPRPIPHSVPSPAAESHLVTEWHPRPASDTLTNAAKIVAQGGCRSRSLFRPLSVRSCRFLLPLFLPAVS